MAWKCIRMLTVVMMELLILILEVQTNDLTPTSFSHSALPIQHVHSSKLDRVEEPLKTCFEDWLHHCRRTWPNFCYSHYKCIILGATICLIQTIKEGEEGSPLSKCFTKCQKDVFPNNSFIAGCYTICFTKHILCLLDVVYMQYYTQLKVW